MTQKLQLPDTPESFDNKEHGATGTAFGVEGVDLKDSLSLGDKFINVPGGKADWSFNAGDNYKTESGSVDIVITPYDAEVTVTGYTGIFDNKEHGATGTAFGVEGVDLKDSLSLGDKFINVPGGKADWSFNAGDNYKTESGSVDIVITPYDAEVTVTGYTGIFDNKEHGATGTAFGVEGVDLKDSLSLGDKFINVPGGKADWSFNAGDNYKTESGSVDIVITPYDAEVTVTGYTGIFDNKEHGATGTAFGVEGVDLKDSLSLGDKFINVPGGKADWSFNAGDNYKTESGSVDIVITPYDAEVTVTGYTGIFDNKEHGATGTAFGVEGVDLKDSLSLGDKFINVPGGKADWSFNAGDNYKTESGSVDIVITPYDAEVTVTGYTGIFDNKEHGATGTAFGVEGVDLKDSLSLGDKFINVPGGKADWSFNAGDNYKTESGSVDIVITPYDAEVTVTGYTGIFDNKEHGATGTAFGVEGVDLKDSLSLGDKFINVPGGKADWSFNAGDNYKTESGSVDIVITPYDAEVTVTGYTGIFDNKEHGATGTAFGVEGVDLKDSLSLGDKFINVPGGKADWSFNAGDNYKTESGSVDIVITPYDAEVTVTGYTGIFDNKEHGATGTAFGVEGVDLKDSLSLGDKFINVPGGKADWSFNAGDNYKTESGSVDIVITPYDAEVTVTGYTGIFDNKRARGNRHGIRC